MTTIKKLKEAPHQDIKQLKYKTPNKSPIISKRRYLIKVYTYFTVILNKRTPKRSLSGSKLAAKVLDS